MRWVMCWQPQGTLLQRFYVVSQNAGEAGVQGMLLHASSPCSLQRRCVSTGRATPRALVVHGLGHSTPLLHGPGNHASCVLIRSPPQFFSCVPNSETVCTQASPHTCPTQPCMQDDFSSFIFRRQTGSILSCAAFLPGFTLPIWAIQHSSAAERVALHSVQGSFCASCVSTPYRIAWWMRRFK